MTPMPSKQLNKPTPHVKNKLRAILNILRGRPTIYRTTFDTASLHAIRNKNLYATEIKKLEVNAAGFRDRIIVDGKIVHDPNRGKFGWVYPQHHQDDWSKMCIWLAVGVFLLVLTIGSAL